VTAGLWRRPKIFDLKVLSENRTPDRASRLVVRYIVRDPLHLYLRMTARYAHLTDTQVQGAVAALDAIFDATRYASKVRKSKGFLKLWTKEMVAGDRNSFIPFRDQIGISDHLHRNRQAALPDGACATPLNLESWVLTPDS
jgi:hypothetical protein